MSKSRWGSRQATETTAGAAGSAEAGAAATGVLDDGERAPLGSSAEAGAAARRAHRNVLVNLEKAIFL